MAVKKEEAGLLAQTDPKEKDLICILPQFEAAVKKHDLRSTLGVLNLLPKGAVEILRRSFPSFDKTVLSKCCNPAKYGCVLHPDGYAALRGLIKRDEEPESQQMPPAAPQRRKSSTHKFTCRVAGRLPDGKYLLLQRYIRMEGYETTQDWVTAQVDAYLTEMEVKYADRHT